MRELLRIGGMNVFDLLEEQFDSDALKGALGFDAVLGTNFGPRSPGTVLTLLYRMAAESAGGAAALSQPKGGLGAVCDALAKSAAALGATIRTASPVARILVAADRAAGVELESGECIEADRRRVECRSEDHLLETARCKIPGHRIRAPREPYSSARACRQTASRAGPRTAIHRRGLRVREGPPASRAVVELPRAGLQPREVRRIFQCARDGNHRSHAERAGIGPIRQACLVGHRSVRALCPEGGLAGRAAAFHPIVHRRFGSRGARAAGQRAACGTAHASRHRTRVSHRRRPLAPW